MKYLIQMILIMIVFNANASMRLFDTGEPIELNLSVNNEILLKFDEHIASIAIKVDKQDKLISESIDKRWWIKSTTVLEKTKVLVKDTQGKIIVFIISATINNKDVIKSYQVISEQKQIKKEKKERPYSSVKKTSLVDLTRFAAQSLYAPERLIQKIDLERIPIFTKNIHIFDCSLTLACLELVAKPVIAWTNGNYFISAIEIKNLTNKVINLDPRYLIGNFISATFQFNRVGAINSNIDTTVLYVVSKQALEQSL